MQAFPKTFARRPLLFTGAGRPTEVALALYGCGAESGTGPAGLRRHDQDRYR
jgi:hypothetical protein